MDILLQSAALVLVAVILSQVLSRQSREMGLLLTLAVCCMVCAAAVGFLEPVVELLQDIRRIAQLDPELVAVILKAAGIGLLSELAGLICADAGEGAMGKALQLLANAAILWISLPLLRELITLLEEVLTGV